MTAAPWYPTLTEMPVIVSEGFGARLRDLRQAHGWSERRLAVLLTTESSNISRWESNEVRPRYEMLLKLCRALGVSPNELMGWQNDP